MGKRGTPRASCDPCRRKKVKCDKDQRNAEGISLCTFCCARGYDCIITDDARHNADTSDTDAANGAQGSTSASASSANKKRKKSDAGAAGPGLDQDSFAVPEASLESDMLQVRGLTRSILDNAVASHFRTTYWCNPAVDPGHFFPRYRRYLSKLDGIASSSAEQDALPSADIIILAAACVGVMQLSSIDSRFELQARIFRRLEKLVAQACTKDITVALDVLEAILLTLDVPARIKSVDEATNSSLDAGFVHPMSHTNMIRLVIYHGLNRSRDDPVVKARRLKYHTPGRAIVCEMNDDRIPLILAVASVNDIIRSFDMFDRHQLLQEDIDPDATMVNLGGPIGNQWGWQLSVLATVLRTNNLAICAARSRRLGLSPSAVLDVLEQLERFERQMPDALRWDLATAESDGSSSGQLIAHDNSSEDIISIVVRKAFLNLLLWSQYRCIHNLAHAHGLQRPAQGSRDDGSLYMRARRRCDALLLTALNRMSDICPQLASFQVSNLRDPVNLLDYSSIAFRSSIKGAAYYTLEIAKLTFRAGLHDLAADLLAKAGKMIYAFRTYQCHPDTQAEATRMRNILLSLYSEFEMIPGLGPTNDARLRQERERFSYVFEPAAALQDPNNTTAALVSDLSDMQWIGGGNGASAPLSTAASWSTPGTADDLATFGGSMNEFLAGLPFVNASNGPASVSPHPVSFAPKTPASTATAAASPFDLNAFLDTHIEPNSIPNAREAPSNF